MPKTVSPPHLYSLREVSEAGYGSIATLRRAIRDGRLQAVYAGDRVKVGLRVKMCVWLGVSRGLDLAFLNAD